MMEVKKRGEEEEEGRNLGLLSGTVLIIVISYEVSMVYDTETQIKLLGSIFCNLIYYVNILFKKKRKNLGLCRHMSTLWPCNFIFEM